MRARMPSLSVSRRRQEDYLLTWALGSIQAGFLWAHAPITMETHGDFVRTNFSGVLCLDEVHDSGRTILVAPEPLGDFTVSFKGVDKNAQAHLAMGLHALKDRGLPVEGVRTDGAPLDQDSRQSSWADVEPQLGLFPVSKEGNKLILDGGRAITNRLKRQGNKGRKKRRGRPSKKAPQPRQRRPGMSQTAQAPCIWDHPSLIVRPQAACREQDKPDLALMLPIAPALTLFRQCNPQWYRLLARGITQPCARARRTRLVNTPQYQANPLLAKALKKLRKDKLDHMSVFLGWEHGERTNKQVEVRSVDQKPSLQLGGLVLGGTGGNA